MTAADYAWAIRNHALGLNFCLTFARGVGPDEVISRLGGADPVSVVSAQVARGGSEAVREWIDENGGSHPTGLDYVAVTRVGDWAMIVEDNGFLCTGDAAVRELSSAGEMVSFYYNENTTPRFFWAIDGQQVVWFDPAFPQDRYGSDPGRLDAILVELGFVLDEDEEEFDDAYDEAYKERTLALMERITGVRWDADLLASATFRCAGVGRRAVTEPWYAEVREELAAYAEDPREWFSRDVDPWRGRGVTDPRVKALGAAGMRLYDEDRELALAIAHAPADLIERMTTWAWERPFRLAGIPDEPWLTRIRERLRRAGTVTPADGRLVAERLDAYLRTALPVWQRDDPRQRTNAVGALLMPWNAQRPADNLCWMFAKAEGAGGGTWPEMFADLRRDFPDLRDIVIPPPPPAPVERAAVRRKREARERREAEGARRGLERTWGGRIPTDERLLEPEVQARTLGLVGHDRDIVDRIAEAGPQTQRRMAVWAARYCCTRSGLIAHDWVEAAVTALERGDPPPPWFVDFDAAFARWANVPREIISRRVTVSFGHQERPAIDPEIRAIHAVVMARDDDPLIAAMDGVRNAVELDAPGEALAAFRAAFNLR
ncbi:hypothetical protein GCM10009682_49990 [Luedemannella flava]|uniref:SMI1/KNR4 family protein n=1 Tax=Luedemannella flava TaxID=349316 RepID=A0ABN2MEH9_9ACTN